MTAIRTLHIVPSLRPQKGGVPFSAAEIICKEVQETDNSVHVVSVDEQADTNSPLVKRLQHYTNPAFITDYSRANSELKALCAKVKPDILVLWLPDLTPHIYQFLKETHLPFVVRASTTYDMRRMTHAQKHAYRECFNLVKAKNGKIICNSRATKDWNHLHFGVPYEQQKVIRETINLDALNTPPMITRNTLGIAPDAHVVLNVTRVSSENGVNYRKDPFGFILAASYLSRIYPNTVFVMSGDGTQWSNSYIQKLLDKANAFTGGNLSQDRFKALGHIENPQDLYRLSNVLISNPISEAFGRTVAEAMQFGVPSIVTDTGVLKKINGKIARAVPIREFSYETEDSYYGNPKSNQHWLNRLENAFGTLYRRSPERVASDAAYLKERVAKEYDGSQGGRKHADIYKKAIAAHRAQAGSHAIG